MRVLFFLFFALLSSTLGAQKNVTISGTLTDESTGESLIGANVYAVSNPLVGTSTNLYGFYSLQLKADTNYTIVFSYAGYQDLTHKVRLQSDTILNISLSQGVTMDEIIVRSVDKKENVESTTMGTVSLPVQELKKIPVLFGEVDILKTLQLLPGVSSGTEGNAGFFVRGGGADQNLVLLDDATVYNSGHLLGFFSVFNADAIKNTTLIKGSLPSKYGGRLSSVVDIQMKEGNNQNFQAEGGIGIIASRLTVEGPLAKDRASFIVSGRRTYALDIAQPFLSGSNFDGTNYYFYDLNAKMNVKVGEKDRLYASGYFGRDVFRFNSSRQDFSFDLPYGNTTATLRWNHIFSDKLFMNTSIIYNDYQFEFEGGQENFIAQLYSGVQDFGSKIDWDYYVNPSHFVQFGVTYTYHALQPSSISATTGETNFSNDLPTKYGHEYAIYLQDEWKLSSRLTANIGFRWSLFSHVGPYSSPIDGRKYDKGEHIVTYQTPEPRLSLRYKLNQSSSIKAGIAYTAQYLHLVSNSTSTLPIDIWVPSTELVKPQRGIQYALGYFKNFNQNEIEFSAEVYYRDMYNQIDYRDDYVNNPAQEVELDFVFGQGRAYGMELLLRKQKGDFTGWIAYTLSRTERSFSRIESGRWYPAFYDRTHDLSVVGSYTLTPKWNISGTFVLGTGIAYTPLAGVYRIEDRLNTFYGPRNSARLPTYHRMDISVQYVPKPKSKRKFRSSWNFSIYNVYSRLNPTFVYSAFEAIPGTQSVESSAFQVSLFPIIPSITWNFKWNGS